MILIGVYTDGFVFPLILLECLVFATSGGNVMYLEWDSKSNNLVIAVPSIKKCVCSLSTTVRRKV